MMFVRCVSSHLKQNKSAKEAVQLLESKVLPLLSRYHGFREAMALTPHEGNEMLAISIWESREDAEAYQREALPEVMRILADYIDGTPQIKTYDLSYSTIHRASATGA